MELEHHFELPVGLETAWTALTDIEKVGACFPGVTMDSVDGHSFQGSLKLKEDRPGPLPAAIRTFSCQGGITEQDHQAHRAQIEATGSDGSAGNAAVLITVDVTALSPGRTGVDLLTTLSITGRPEKVSRGVVVDVTNALISEFADCLSNDLTGRPAGGAHLVDVTNPDEAVADVAGAAAADDVPAPAAGSDAAPTSVSALQKAAVPVLERVLPFLFGAIGLVLLRRLFRRNPTAAQLAKAADRAGGEADRAEQASARTDKSAAALEEAAERLMTAADRAS